MKSVNYKIFQWLSEDAQPFQGINTGQNNCASVTAVILKHKQFYSPGQYLFINFGLCAKNLLILSKNPVIPQQLPVFLGQR